MRNAYITVRIPEGERPRGKPRRRSEANIKVDLKEVWNEDVNGIHLCQNKDQ
jgi:hypothetical protein